MKLISQVDENLCVYQLYECDLPVSPGSSKENGNSDSYVSEAIRIGFANKMIVFTIRWQKLLVGMIALESRVPGCGKLHLEMSPDYRGKGLMTRSCRVVIDHCLKELGLDRIEIQPSIQNGKCRAVPERLGFRYDGNHVVQTPRGKVTLARYSLTRSENGQRSPANKQ